MLARVELVSRLSLIGCSLGVAALAYAVPITLSVRTTGSILSVEPSAASKLSTLYPLDGRNDKKQNADPSGRQDDSKTEDDSHEQELQARMDFFRAAEAATSFSDEALEASLVGQKRPRLDESLSQTPNDVSLTAPKDLGKKSAVLRLFGQDIYAASPTQAIASIHGQSSSAAAPKPLDTMRAGSPSAPSRSDPAHGQKGFTSEPAFELDNLDILAAAVEDPGKGGTDAALRHQRASKTKHKSLSAIMEQTQRPGLPFTVTTTTNFHAPSESRSKPLVAEYEHRAGDSSAITPRKMTRIKFIAPKAPGLNTEVASGAKRVTSTAISPDSPSARVARPMSAAETARAERASPSSTASPSDSLNAQVKKRKRSQRTRREPAQLAAFVREHELHHADELLTEARVDSKGPSLAKSDESSPESSPGKMPDPDNYDWDSRAGMADFRRDSGLRSDNPRYRKVFKQQRRKVASFREKEKRAKQERRRNEREAARAHAAREPAEGVELPFGRMTNPDNYDWSQKSGRAAFRHDNNMKSSFDPRYVTEITRQRRKDPRIWAREMECQKVRRAKNREERMKHLCTDAAPSSSSTSSTS